MATKYIHQFSSDTGRTAPDQILSYLKSLPYGAINLSDTGRLNVCRRFKITEDQLSRLVKQTLAADGGKEGLSC